MSPPLRVKQTSVPAGWMSACNPACVNTPMPRPSARPDCPPPAVSAIPRAHPIGCYVDANPVRLVCPRVRPSGTQESLGNGGIMIRATGLATLFLAAWTQITQADFSENIRRCDSDGTHPDIQIAACTRNIQSGRFTGRNLAVAFTNRGLAYKRKGQWDRAIADYSEAISLKYDDAHVFN